MNEDPHLKSLIQQLQSEGKTIAYLDEVGRGAIFGELVVGCVILQPGFFHPDIDDSKKLDPETRKRLSPIILENVKEHVLEITESHEINRLKNIGICNKLSMMRALRKLRNVPDVVFIDGKEHLGLDFEEYAVIHGDARVFGIACASVIAKVFRDNLVVETYAPRYPQYSLHTNKGYRSPHHYMAIRKYGLRLEHRAYLPQVCRVVNGDYDEVIERKYKEVYPTI